MVWLFFSLIFLWSEVCRILVPHCSPWHYLCIWLFLSVVCWCCVFLSVCWCCLFLSVCWCWLQWDFIVTVLHNTLWMCVWVCVCVCVCVFVCVCVCDSERPLLVCLSFVPTCVGYTIASATFPPFHASVGNGQLSVSLGATLEAAVVEMTRQWASNGCAHGLHTRQCQ